ncbi:hypothetical protein LWP59_35155 [Amycolatopsis acidiphila]|uniref:Uncharacterized protein n=1 Tax=Amycolatopsis acidiphila TaxID=715473 RepID=A0A557ZQ74_9PSEU|nr:hypothetical protein [Amycolatopsis acidiphila]TVT14167.1 hypothetical protein FNH06_38105 [Amycolatopsis acidiphila]UIJ59229.1 hypothetical protein LWP59_35155 [Amycolatopsis acidiphila]GHG79258.1 hypothetical protein GCM10017788_47190 [Amycolatopsis acidiphila]
MNDEVSVAELLEREGWGDVDRKPNGRMRVVAVMLAVVLGCGLAAILVHFGSQNSEADSPSLFNLPHGPTGGLAGGGVPAAPTGSEVTGLNTTVIVTNETEILGTGIDGIPWHKHKRETETQTVTVTGSADPGQGDDPSTGGRPPVTTTPTATPGGPAGGNGGRPSSDPGKPPTKTTTPPPCVLGILFC